MKKRATIPAGSLLLEHRGRGDIVRISDDAKPNAYNGEAIAGRMFELEWPMWPHGTKKNDQPKVRIEGWFAREALEPFGAEDDFGVSFEFARDKTWLPVDTVVVELVLEKSVDGNARIAAIGNERGGGDSDPLRLGTATKPGQSGRLW